MKPAKRTAYDSIGFQFCDEDLVTAGVKGLGEVYVNTVHLFPSTKSTLDVVFVQEKISGGRVA